MSAFAVRQSSVVLLIALLPWTAVTAQAPGPHAQDHKHDDDTPHVHAPVPAEYKAAHLPAAAWTSQFLLARGKDLYVANCSVCHGERGEGNGPAAVGLPLKPASFQDARMVNEMAGNYWFWRVSEGGLVEPFRSMGSVMPAWKGQLSVEDRWAVIAYTHRLSGHEGPHVTSEHPQMLSTGHGDPGTTAEPPTAKGAPSRQERGPQPHKH